MPRPTYSEAYRDWVRGLAVAVGLAVAIVLAAVALLLGLEDPPAWLGVAAAVTGMAPIAWIFISGFVFSWRWEGVEQVVYARSTSTAFFVLMITSGICGMLEAFVRIDPISAWFFYLLGGASWSGMSLWLAHRMS